VVDQKLSVTVQVDLDGRTVRILVAGCLTEASQRALQPLIRRARALTPGIHVTVDLTALHHVEAAGVELLRRSADHDEGADRLRPVDYLLPVPPPVPAGVHGHVSGSAGAAPGREVRRPGASGRRTRVPALRNPPMVAGHAAP